VRTWIPSHREKRWGRPQRRFERQFPLEHVGERTATGYKGQHAAERTPSASWQRKGIMRHQRRRMARFLLVIAGVLATLHSQPVGAVQPCAYPNTCAQLSITSATGLPGDVANVEIWFQQGPSDGAPGGVDEIAALALTLSFDVGGADAPLWLADCSENVNGLPNAVTPDAALANFNIVVQNATCTGGRTHCLCPDPTSGIAPDRFLNLAVYGPVVNSGATPAVATLPSGRFVSIAFQIEATATGTVPLHVYNTWTDSQHPQSTAFVSMGDDLQVDQTCAPLAKPPCGPGSVSQLAITDGAIVVIATPTPTPTCSATATATPTSSTTAAPSSTATVTPTGTATLTPTQTGTGTASPSGTPTPTPSATPSSSPTGTPVPTSTPTPILTPTFTPSPPRCVGDCNNDGVVTVDEILMLVDFALQGASPLGCPVSDEDGNQQITLDEILTAVHNALNGCPSR